MACLAIENLAFAVDDILLQIVGDGLAHAEVFHGVGDVEPELLAQPEVVIHSSTSCENHCCVVIDRDFCLSEFL